MTLSWTRPTTNEDGSVLTDLTGYRVYYGQVPYNWSARVSLGPAASSADIRDLSAGTWFFAVTTVNSGGVESAPSTVVSTMISPQG